ncbi:unnamed protein product [Staurois parvus]|uniref:Uncharacterized protein n=1 Tax=Staurois parvus TaxID=386267 RepID=A0ABN9C3Y3_9NEOB|nr:unnamed protein product [Staurois parvus]
MDRSPIHYAPQSADPIYSAGIIGGGCHQVLPPRVTPTLGTCFMYAQGRTDHLETRALREGPGSVGCPMRCPWYLFHRLF